MIQYTPVKELFHIGNFTIYSWGFMFVVAFLVAFFLILREAKKKEIDERHIYSISLLVLVGAIVGARLFHIFENLPYYFQNPIQILAFNHGGMTSYGGIFLAIVFAWLYIRRQKDIGFGKILDLYAPYIALALAIGRIGCFLNWCCYGHASGMLWALKVADDVARHPTQIYESVAYLITFFILIKIKNIKEIIHANRKEKSRFFGFDVIKERSFVEKPGFLFLSFLILYSVFRFLIDFFREYSVHWLGLALSQWICIAIIVLSATMLLKKR